MGIIEFSGVLSSWATDEKKVALSFWPSPSTCLILVISLHIAIIWVPLLITEVLTWMYLSGFLALNIVSTLALSVPSWISIKYSHRFSLILCPTLLSVDHDEEVLTWLFLSLLSDFLSSPSLFGLISFSLRKKVQKFSYTCLLLSPCLAPRMSYISLLTYDIYFVFMSMMSTPLGTKSRVF